MLTMQHNVSLDDSEQFMDRQSAGVHLHPKAVAFFRHGDAIMNREHHDFSDASMLMKFAFS